MPTQDMLESEGPPYMCLVCSTGQIPAWPQYSAHLGSKTHIKKVFNLPLNSHLTLTTRLEALGLAGGPARPAPDFAADEGDFPALGAAPTTRAAAAQPAQSQPPPPPRNFVAPPQAAASTTAAASEPYVDRRTQSERSGNVRLVPSLNGGGAGGRAHGQPRNADVPKTGMAESILRDFRSGKSVKLTHQLLNEYCVAMRGTVEYLPTSPTSARLGFAYYARVTVDGVAHDYEVGEAESKQKAKQEAARLALMVIARRGQPPRSEASSLSASAVAVGNDDSASTTTTTAGTTTASAAAAMAASAAELPGDRYSRLCQQQLDSLLRDVRVVGVRRVAAIFLSDSRQMEPKVELVALGTGSGCIDETLDAVYNAYGESVIDSTAFTGAKRALRIRLAQEVAAFVRSGRSPDGWLEPSRHGDRLRLKPGLALHLFLSAPPDGDCSVGSQDAALLLAPPTPEELLRDRSGVLEPDLMNAGALACYEDSACTAVRPFSAEEAADPDSLAVHCGSDKLLMCNYVGLQGGLLANFVEPLFLQSVDVAGRYSHGDMARGFLCRLPGASLRRRMPAPAYRLARDPWLGRTTGSMRLPESLNGDEEEASLSINWYQPADGSSPGQAEVVESRIGKKDMRRSLNVSQAERQSGSDWGISRLSKVAALKRSVNLAGAAVNAWRDQPAGSPLAMIGQRLGQCAASAGGGKDDSFEGVSLRRLKCQSYAKAKRLVADELARRARGLWASKGGGPLDPEDFNLL